MNSNLTDEYEIIIVGAGVAGLMLAHLLDDCGFPVLLLEKKPTVTIEPRTFGTFTRSAREHGLEYYIVNYFDTFAFYGPTAKASGTEKDIMCLVDYQRWANDLELRNISIKTNVDLQQATRSNDGIILTDLNRSYFGKLIVDGSGYAQVVSKLLGLPVFGETGLSFEVELENCHFPIEKEAAFILNTDVSNSGGWLYILQDGRAQFGWADFYPESGADLKDLKYRTLNAMKNIGPHNTWLKQANVTYSYGRFGPTGHLKHRVEDNFLAIGDAGGFGTPVTLEGFREALDSAKFAHLTITETKNYCKSALLPYLRRFRSKHGKYYRMHHIVRFLYLHWFRNQDIDRWIGNFKQFDNENFFKLIKGELTVSLMIRTMDMVLFKDLALNVINSVLPAFLQFRESIEHHKFKSRHETL